MLLLSVTIMEGLRSQYVKALVSVQFSLKFINNSLAQVWHKSQQKIHFTAACSTKNWGSSSTTITQQHNRLIKDEGLLVQAVLHLVELVTVGANYSVVLPM